MTIHLPALGRVPDKLRRIGAALLLCVAAVAVFSATATYEYDEAGRLRKVVYDNGTTTTYVLDAVGNRTTVSTGVPAGTPGSITVPSGSANGSYTISWTAPASGGTVTAYQLFEATNSSFTGEVQAYTGLNLSLPVTGKANGTYYYRVRACANALCGGYATGANPVQVSIPPGVPSSITVPATNNTGTFTVSWGTASGTVTAYELWEATNSSFTGETRVYNSTGTSTPLTRGGGTYYYHVRACNGPNCSAFTAGAPSIVVSLPPAAPGSITAPATNSTGAYTVSWASVTGTVTAYELWEANNSGFTGETRIYNSNAATSFGVTGKANGTYYYRVRACNAVGCSGYATSTGTTVAQPPSAPPSISVPASSNTGSYSVSWADSTGTVTAYELYEATNSAFTGQTLAYSGTNTVRPISGKGNGSYWYRVRGCNGAGNCSGYTAGSAPTVVTLPPGQPGALTIPSSSVSGVYTVTWVASSGTLTQYQLEQYRNDPFFTTIPVVYTPAVASQSIAIVSDGTYSYRVRACNGSVCSGYSNGSNSTTVTLTPGAPTSLSNPSSSINGAYTVSWATVGGTVTAYELYEATNSSFTGQTLAFSGTATSAPISGKGDGSYWYRVRACNGSGNCGGYTAGAAATVVLLPPGLPGNLTIPGSSVTGAYTVSWGPSTGTITQYQLEQFKNDPTFSQIPFVMTPTGPSAAVSGNNDGLYYYRVRACNASGCSGYRNGGNATSVALTPAAPASIAVPSSNNTGAYSISWAGVSGTVTAYELYEAVNSSFSGETLVYSGTGTSTSLSGKIDNFYWYRVRACNGAGNCGGYASGGPNIVLRPPGQPGALSIPSSSMNGIYTISWGNASGVIASFQLEQFTNSSFSGTPVVWTTNGATSTTVTVSANGTYYYRVRACNGGGCGPYSNGGNGVSVLLPPGAPSSFSVPSSSSNGTISLSWGTASGSGITYYVGESTNSSFAGEANVFIGTGTSTTLTGRGNGSYWYRVMACNNSGCGPLVSGGPTVVTLPSGSINITSMQVYVRGYPSAEAHYYLGNDGSISSNTFSGFWITPQQNMGNYEVHVDAGGTLCQGSFPTGYVPLSTSRGWSTFAQDTDGGGDSQECLLTVKIRAIANPSVILGEATIDLVADAH